jgi:ferredoxin
MTETVSRSPCRRVESFLRIDQDVDLGEVRIDPDLCTGCGSCVRACPAASLELYQKKARMLETRPLCMSCGDCAALCPEGAIELVRFIQFRQGFRYLGRGAPERPRRF